MLFHMFALCCWNISAHQSTPLHPWHLLLLLSLEHADSGRDSEESTTIL